MDNKEKLMNAIKEYCEATDIDWNNGSFAEMLENHLDFDLDDLILFGFSDEALSWCHGKEAIAAHKEIL